MFAEACRQLAEWMRDYPELPLIVRVNMSPAEFAATDLVEFVENCLKGNNIPGERLCIEITEYAVVDEPEKTASILRGFREIGVEVAIDDFGTGFASMTELKHLPVDLLKLDMSFVEGITTDAYDRAIVESIIRLGQVLNLGVTAEGIERVDIIEELLTLGCHRGQGYLISRPVAPEDLKPMLKAGSVPESMLRPCRTHPRTSEHDILNPTVDGASEDAFGPDQQQYEPWLFQTMLDELSVSELGIGFIYSVLDLLVKRYALSDAVVILSHESFGPQMFRAGGQSISADFAARIGTAPGVYCEPDVVPNVERDAVRTACQLAHLAAPRALQRGPRSAHEHRQPTHLRQRPAGGVRAQFALRLGLHARAR